MKWMVPKTKLSDNQLEITDAIVKGAGQTHWITGYAGSGKTVVITHALNEVAARFPKDTIGFLTYTHSLKDMVASGLANKVKDRVEIHTLDHFNFHKKKFDHLFVDEIQDAKREYLPKILASSPHVVVAGDPDQSIYTNRLTQAELLKALGRPKRHVLPEVFRFSDNTLRIAKAVYPEAKLVGGARMRAGDSLDASLIREKNEHDEVVTVWETARLAAMEELPSAILLPQHKHIHRFAQIIAKEYGLGSPPIPVRDNNRGGEGWNYGPFNEFFRSKRFPLMFLGSNHGSFEASDDDELVYMLTYHSAKGLDFQHTFVPFLVPGTRIKENFEDDALGRRKFLVALTRARYQQTLSYHGNEQHEYLELIPDDLFD